MIPPLPDDHPNRRKRERSTTHSSARLSQGAPTRAVGRFESPDPDDPADPDPAIDVQPPALDTSHDNATPSESQHPAHIIIQFDGACRSNGSDNAKAAAAVFVSTYDSPYSRATKIAVTTNQAAEIIAAAMAAETALRIATDGFAAAMTLRGDSQHVVSAVTSGRLLSYRPWAHLPNSAHWVRLANAINALTEAGVSFKFEWCARSRNREPDELANALLDNRPHAPVTSEVAVATLSPELLAKALAHVLQVRFRCFRSLPREIAPLWRSLIVHFVTAPPPIDRLLFWLAPTLLSDGGTLLQGRTDFKRLRTHVGMLHNDEYLLQCVLNVMQRQPTHATRQPQSPLSPEAIHALCANGNAHRAIPDDSPISLHPTPLKHLPALFPQRALPDPLQPLVTHAASISWAELHAGVRKAARNRAAGFSGWCRELVTPLLFDPPPLLAAWLPAFATLVVNTTHLLPVEQDLLTRTVGVALWNAAKARTRPIQLADFWTKIMWLVALDRIQERDLSLARSPQFAVKKSGCAAVVLAIFAALRDGQHVISIDARNAFNTVSRCAAFDHVRRHPIYLPFHAWINLFYARESQCTFFAEGTSLTIPVTAGTRQGCASGPWFFAIASLSALSPPLHTLAYADDIYVHHKDEAEATSIAASVIASLSTNLHLSVHDPCNLRYSDEASVLGAVLAPSEPVFLRATRPWIERLQRTCDSVVSLPANIQDRIHILRAVQRRIVYAAQTFSGPATGRDALFCAVSEIFCSAVSRFCPVPQDSYARIFLPTECRGLGFLPFDAIHNDLQALACSAVISTLQTRGLQAPIDHVPTSTSVAISWRQAARAAGEKQSKHPNIFERWPSPPHALSDQETLMAVGVLCETLPPIDYTCALTLTNLRDLSPSDRFQHVFTCAHCGAIHYQLRHNKVVHAIRTSLSRCGIFVSSSPSVLPPLPNRERGGADLAIVADKLYVLDVAVALPHAVRSRATAKTAKYREYIQRSGHHFVPAVFSTDGEPCSELDAFLKKIQIYAGVEALRTDIIGACQREIIRGITIGISTLANRSTITTSDVPIANQPTSDAPTETAELDDVDRLLSNNQV